jgi:hypothetical protein
MRLIAIIGSRQTNPGRTIIDMQVSCGVPEVGLGRDLGDRRSTTRAGRRVIPLPDVVVTALREQRKRQEAERAEAGEQWEDTGFVFTTRRGRPMSPYTLTKYWHDVRTATSRRRLPR